MWLELYRRHEEISIHALFAEGDLGQGSKEDKTNISIHALFAEGDAGVVALDFLHTISIHALFAEGDRVAYHPKNFSKYISIHALFAEGDDIHLLPVTRGLYFYPRPLRRGRQRGASRRG